MASQDGFTLQRIAAALERIADHYDAKVEREIEALTPVTASAETTELVIDGP